MGILKAAADSAAGLVGNGGHYDVTVNKNDLNVRHLTDTLNGRWKDGWSLAHIFEQNGNTVMVFERRG